MKKLFILTGVVLSAMTTYNAQGETELPSKEEMVKGMICKKEINRYSANWMARKDVDWSLRLGDMANSVLVRPTSKIAHWITYSKVEKEEILQWVTPVETLVVKFHKNCRGTFETRPSSLPLLTLGRAQSKDIELFTDAHLIDVLSYHKQGVLAFWSPGMGHSITAMKDLIEIEKQFSIPVTFILDPTANPTFAENVLKKHKIKDVPMRSMASLELLYRQGTHHYPNFFVYKNGQIISNVLPGLMGKDNTKRTIERYLAKNVAK